MMFEHYITLNSWAWLVTEEVLSLPPPNPAPANQEQDWETLTNERPGLAQVVGAGWGQLSWSVDRELCILFPLNLLSYVCCVTTSQSMKWSETETHMWVEINSDKSVKQMKSYKKWPGFAKLLNLFIFSPFPNEYIWFWDTGSLHMCCLCQCFYYSLMTK